MLDPECNIYKDQFSSQVKAKGRFRSGAKVRAFKPCSGPKQRKQISKLGLHLSKVSELVALHTN